MKTSLLVIFSAVTLALQAQTSVYHPFPDSNAVWTIYNYRNTVNPNCQDWGFYQYSISGDTIIGVYVYKKIVSKPLCSYAGCGVGGGGIDKFIRQDTSLRRVYLYWHDFFTTTDTLLYDFSLKVGDTLKTFLAVGGYAVVLSMDSVLIQNQYRKKINLLNNSNQTLFIIEGIGSNYGLLEHFENVSEAGSSLACFETTNDTFSVVAPVLCYECARVTGINDLSSFPLNYQVFPNPATKHLTITTNTNAPSEIIIYDIASRKLMEEKFIKEVSLNIAHLAKGVYLYQVTDEKGMIGRGKVVKE